LALMAYQKFHSSNNKEYIKTYRREMLLKTRNSKRKIKFTPKTLVSSLVQHRRNQMRHGVPFPKYISHTRGIFMEKRKREDNYDDIQSENNKKTCNEKYEVEFEVHLQELKNKENIELDKMKSHFERQVQMFPDDRTWFK